MQEEKSDPFENVNFEKEKEIENIVNQYLDESTPDEVVKANADDFLKLDKSKCLSSSKKLNDITKYFGDKQVDNNSDSLLTFGILKKLKKKSRVELEKKIKKKISFANYFDVEAELGSDDENHDDVVKKANDDDEEKDDENLNQDLKDLIADEEIDPENQNADEEILKQKYFDDMLDKDKEEVRKVIEGPDQKEILNLKRSRSGGIIENEDMPLQMRMKRYKSENEAGDESNHEFNFKMFMLKMIHNFVM